MDQQYNPYKNAVAKRINERSKYKFRLKTNYKNSTLAKTMIKRVLSINNKKTFQHKIKYTWFYSHKSKYKKNKQNLEYLIF